MSDPERIKNVLKQMVVTGERSDDGSRLPSRCSLSLSFCCPVEARRNSGSFGRSVGSLGRSLSFFLRCDPGHKAKPIRHFGKKKN